MELAIQLRDENYWTQIIVTTDNLTARQIIVLIGIIACLEINVR